MIKALTMSLMIVFLSTQADARPRHSHRAIGTTLVSDTSEQILPHPAGCPRSAFCGCGAMNDLGVTDKNYMRAAYWVHYTGPGTVAVWNHHVAVVESLLGDGTAILRDYNSGGHLSRRHVRSIAGARIVGGGTSLAYAEPKRKGHQQVAQIAPAYSHGGLN